MHILFKEYQKQLRGVIFDLNNHQKKIQVNWLRFQLLPSACHFAQLELNMKSRQMLTDFSFFIIVVKTKVVDNTMGQLFTNFQNDNLKNKRKRVKKRIRLP